MPARLTDEEATACAQQYGLQPLEPYPGTTRPWLCRCMTCGREVRPRLGGIRNGVGACRHCGKARAAATHVLNVGKAIAFMVQHGLRPVSPYPGAGYAWKCECLECGNQVSPRYNSIKQGRNGCSYCSKQRVNPGHAIATMVQVGLVPVEAFPGSAAKWKCRCLTCGHEVESRYHAAAYGHGCSYCGWAKMDPYRPAILYAVASASIVKVGIATETNAMRRVASHRSQGLREVLWVRECSTSHEARNLEQLWKEYLSRVPQHCLTKRDLADGYTEACYWHEGVQEVLRSLNATANSVTKTP